MDLRHDMFYNNKSTIEIQKKNHTNDPICHALFVARTQEKIAKQSEEKNTRKNICPMSREWSCRMSAISNDDSPTFIVFTGSDTGKTMFAFGAPPHKSMQASKAKVKVTPEAMRELHLSVSRNDLTAVARIVASKTLDLNTPITVVDTSQMSMMPNINPTTILCVAVRSSDWAVIRALLDGGANLNCMNEFSTPLLMVAIDRGDCAIVDLLLEAGSAKWLHLRDDFGETSLHLAARSGNPALISSVLRWPDGAALINVADAQGMTPVMAAVFCPDETAVSILINAGADLHVLSKKNDSCCDMACSNRNHRVLDALLSAGAPWDVVSQWACYQVGKNPNPNIMALMIWAGVRPSPNTPVRLFAAGNATVLGLLLANDVGSNERIDYSDVLLRAVNDNNSELLNMYLGESARLELMAKPNRMSIPTSEHVDAMRRRIPSTAFFAIKAEATQICIGLQSLGLDALCTCTIIQCACDPMSRLVPFHQLWALATAVKHFNQKWLLFD